MTVNETSDAPILPDQLKQDTSTKNIETSHGKTQVGNSIAIVQIGSNGKALLNEPTMNDAHEALVTRKRKRKALVIEEDDDEEAEELRGINQFVDELGKLERGLQRAAGLRDDESTDEEEDLKATTAKNGTSIEHFMKIVDERGINLDALHFGNSSAEHKGPEDEDDEDDDDYDEEDDGIPVITIPLGKILAQYAEMMKERRRAQKLQQQQQVYEYEDEELNGTEIATTKRIQPKPLVNDIHSEANNFPISDSDSGGRIDLSREANNQKDVEVDEL